jgi:hypothetical protein
MFPFFLKKSYESQDLVVPFLGSTGPFCSVRTAGRRRLAFAGWSLDGRHRNFVSWPRWVQRRLMFRCTDGCGVVRLRQQRQIQARTPPYCVGQILIQRLWLRKRRDGLTAEAVDEDSRLSWWWRGVPCDGVVGRSAVRRSGPSCCRRGRRPNLEAPFVCLASLGQWRKEGSVDSLLYFIVVVM